LGFRVAGFGLRVPIFEFRVSGFGFRVLGFGFRVTVFGFRVSGFGFLVSDFGFRVSSFKFQIRNRPCMEIRVPHWHVTRQNGVDSAQVVSNVFSLCASGFGIRISVFGIQISVFGIQISFVLYLVCVVHSAFRGQGVDRVGFAFIRKLPPFKEQRLCTLS